MSGTNPFLDTNMLLYLLSADSRKADRAEQLLAAGGTISVQVLNEFASVASRRLALSIPEIREILSAVRNTCAVEALSHETHDRALDLVERYQMSFYDGLIVAAALMAKCDTLYTEDMQDGQRIEALTIRNPFSEKTS
jgi:predicted nucleic acid-binding protein